MKLVLQILAFVVICVIDSIVCVLAFWALYLLGRHAFARHSFAGFYQRCWQRVTAWIPRAKATATHA